MLAASLPSTLVTHSFATWHAPVVIIAVPILKSLLLPAFETPVTFLVPKRHIGRANGTRIAQLQRTRGTLATYVTST
jgi:hypothetical protein